MRFSVHCGGKCVKTFGEETAEIENSEVSLYEIDGVGGREGREGGSRVVCSFLALEGDVGGEGG